MPSIGRTGNKVYTKFQRVADQKGEQQKHLLQSHLDGGLVGSGCGQDD
jgi:hypothetical protein